MGSALRVDTFVIVTFLFATRTVFGLNALLDDTNVLLTKTTAVLACWFGVLLTGSMTTTVDVLAKVLGGIFFVGMLAELVGTTLVVLSASSRDTVIILADFLGTTLVVGVTVDLVAGVGRPCWTALVETNMMSTGYVGAVTVGATLDAHAEVVFALGLGATALMGSTGC